MAYRWYVDESLMGLWKEWGPTRDDVTGPGHFVGTELGMPDPEWIPVVGQAGLVVICRDKRLRTRPGEVTLLLHHRVRALRMGGKQDASTAVYVNRLQRCWRAIEALVDVRTTGPWWYSVNETGLVESRLPQL